LGGAPFFPYKFFPPKSVKTGPLSLLLSICRVNKISLVQNLGESNKDQYGLLHYLTPMFLFPAFPTL
jgi:hypothetical protein